MSELEPDKHVGEQLVSARLQVLQSKRLLMASNQRRQQRRGTEGLAERIEKLRKEIEHAQLAYRVALVRWGSPAMSDYWPAAYSRLIDLADHLALRLENAARGGSVSRRYELSVEVEVLELLIQQWRESLRQTIVKATA